MGFQVERAGWMLEQIAVFHRGHRCTGTGAYLQALVGGAFSGGECFHVGEAQAFNHARCGYGSNHRQGFRQQRQGFRVGMIRQPLGE